MDKPRRILVIQLKRAGDVIVTTPVLQALRQSLPEAAIDFLVDKPFAPLLENNPNIHHIHVYDRQAVRQTWAALRRASYDWILDFQSSPRSVLAGLFSGSPVRAGYRVSFWGRFFNHAMKRPGGRLSVTEGKMNLVRTLVPELAAAGKRRIYLTEAERTWALGHGIKGAIGLIPTHRRPSRRWPAQSFAQLAGLLLAQGHAVWLFWGPGEEEYVAAIQRQEPKTQMIPKTSLREMAALLQQCKMVITNDNGPMHLAVAVDTPTVTVYGPTDPISWNPGGSHHQIVQVSGLTCLGCNLNACPFGHECMALVTPERILAECSRLAALPVGSS